MAPVRAAAACLVIALALAGCGGSGPAVPKGSPDARHGPGAIDAYAQVELLRALLVASSDSFYAGGSADDARSQLRRARAAYDQLGARVGKADPVVHHEVVVRFDRAARELRQGVAPDHYRDIVGPLSDQLMDGVTQALVPPGARSDPGVQAEALRRVALRLAATYDDAGSGGGDARSRLTFEEAWGLWRRAQALETLLGSDLGSQQDALAAALNDLRGPAFPNGPSEPGQPATPKVDKAAARVVGGLDKRFGLSAL